MESYTTSFNKVLKHVLTLLLFILTMQLITLASCTNPTTKTNNKSYIKTACNSTTYPQVCYQSLSAFASTIESDPLKLSITALSVALNSALNTSSTISKLMKRKGLTSIEAAIIKDCVETIRDSVDEIRQSLKVLGDLGGNDGKVEMQMANVKTWISAAVTDEDTCMDGLFDGRSVSVVVKRILRKSILSVAKVTSNALAIINSLSY